MDKDWEIIERIIALKKHSESLLRALVSMENNYDQLMRIGEGSEGVECAREIYEGVADNAKEVIKEAREAGING